MTSRRSGGRLHRGLERETRATIRDRLAFGRARKEDVAREMGFSPRSLDRELAKCDTTYRRVLDAVLRELAERCLLESDQTIDRVAHRLGYADPANFTRAFRRWTGETPRRFRDAGRSGSPDGAK